MPVIRRTTRDQLITAVLAVDALDDAAPCLAPDVRAQVHQAVTMLLEDQHDAEGHLFAGAYYNPAADDARLLRQLGRVFDVMSDGASHTLEELVVRTGDRMPSVSAQLRHLRKAVHGSWIIDVYGLGGGLFTYQMRNPDGTTIPPLSPLAAPAPFVQP